MSVELITFDEWHKIYDKIKNSVRNMKKILNIDQNW